VPRRELVPRRWEFVTADATECVPGTYDRIVSTVGLPAGPGLRPVLAALATGGWIATGSLPLLGADVPITPDGVCHLSQGKGSTSMGVQ
jgi:hypothetical protein